MTPTPDRDGFRPVLRTVEGMRTSDGKLLENTQLEPDIKVRNRPEDIASGRDRQLEAAIKHLLKAKK